MICRQDLAEATRPAVAVDTFVFASINATRFLLSRSALTFDETTS